MKKVYSIFLIFFVVTACDFENIKPQQSISAAGAFQTSDDISAALVGMYDRFQDGDVGGCNITLLSDLLEASDVSWSGSFTSYRDVFNKQMVATNGEVVALWIDGYETILAANAILSALPTITASPDLDDIDTFRANARGQALAMRAIVHFEMCRYFNEEPYRVGTAVSANTQMGIPYIFNASFDFEEIEREENLPSRDNVGVVYTNVITDLTEALSLLGADAPDRISQDVVTAYLIKVRMQQGEWDEVLTLSQNILGNPEYFLESNLKNYFTNEDGSSPESIFQILHNATDNPGVNGSLPTFYNTNARNDIQITPAYLALESDLFNDRQTTELVANNYGTDDNRFSSDFITVAQTTEKYEDFINTADNAPISRLTEILLSRAEALTELNGVNQEAIDLVNSIRQRSIVIVNDQGQPVPADNIINYEIGDFSTAGQLLDAIRLERRVELAFEGHTYHDHVRWGTLPALPEGRSYIFPIPQREIDNNPNLDQNPDYI